MPPPRRSTARLTLAALTLNEQLCLLSGWAPPQPKDRGEPPTRRWADWRSFLADYEELRDEIMQRFAPRHPPGWEPYAAKAQRYADEHGIAALATASDYAILGELEPFEGETSDHYQQRVAALEGENDDDDGAA